MLGQPLDTPQKLASYLTDNVHLRAHLTTFLGLKTDNERQIAEKKFWLFAATLPQNEQDELKGAKGKIAHRLYDRMGSIIVDLTKLTAKKELVLQD